MQHDVQEFNRLLQDNLEAKMKDTPADGAIKDLFMGRMKSYIKCINVNYESSRSEDYYGTHPHAQICGVTFLLNYVIRYPAERQGLQKPRRILQGLYFRGDPRG